MVGDLKGRRVQVTDCYVLQSILYGVEYSWNGQLPAFVRENCGCKSAEKGWDGRVRRERLRCVVQCLSAISALAFTYAFCPSPTIVKLIPNFMTSFKKTLVLVWYRCPLANGMTRE